VSSIEDEDGVSKSTARRGCRAKKAGGDGEDGSGEWICSTIVLYKGVLYNEHGQNVIAKERKKTYPLWLTAMFKAGQLSALASSVHNMSR
jgi:hypothetical protein